VGWARDLVCHGGSKVWVHGVSAIICMSKLIIVRSMLPYYVCCRNYMYIYICLLSISCNLKMAIVKRRNM